MTEKLERLACAFLFPLFFSISTVVVSVVCLSFYLSLPSLILSDNKVNVHDTHQWSVY